MCYIMSINVNDYIHKGKIICNDGKEEKNNMNKITEKNIGIKKVMESIKGMSKKKKAIFCTVATGAVCVGVFVGMELLKPKNVADNKVSVVSKEKKEDKKTSEKDKKEEEKKSSKSETKKEETKTDKDKTSTKEKSDSVKKSDTNSSEKTVSETPKADTTDSQQNSNKGSSSNSDSNGSNVQKPQPPKDNGSSESTEPSKPTTSEKVEVRTEMVHEENSTSKIIYYSDGSTRTITAYWPEVGPDKKYKIGSVVYSTMEEAQAAFDYEYENNPNVNQYNSMNAVIEGNMFGEYRWFIG